MADWDVERPSGRCAATGRALAEGEEFYAVLFERDGTLQRADYCIDSWAGPPPGAFCFWKARVPVREKKRLPLWVDNDVLLNLFVRLGEEPDETKTRFRFVLALLLMRKRLLKFEQTLRDDGREYWQMRLARPADASQPAGQVYYVENPRLDDQQTEVLGAQLRALLSGEPVDPNLVGEVFPDGESPGGPP